MNAANMILKLAFSVTSVAYVTCDTFQIKEWIAVTATFTWAVFCCHQICIRQGLQMCDVFGVRSDWNNEGFIIELCTEVVYNYNHCMTSELSSQPPACGRLKN